MRQTDLSLYRPSISVLCVERDDVMATALSMQVARFGYPETYPTAAAGSVALVMADPPQILVCDLNAPTEIETYLSSIQDASAQTMIILLARPEQMPLAFELVSRGLAYDCVMRPLASPLALAQVIDRATQAIVADQKSQELRQSIASLGGGAPTDLALNDFLLQLSATKETNTVTQIYLETMSREVGAPVLYFKYLASHASLVLAQVAGQDFEAYRGLGLDLKSKSASERAQFFLSPSSATELRRFAKDVLATDDFSAFVHANESEILGLFVCLKDISASLADSGSRLLALNRIYDMAFKKNKTLKEKHVLETTDPLTGLSTRRQFQSQLEVELSRARRVSLPLSLMTIQCDHFSELIEQLGAQPADSLLKGVAAILKQTARLTDVVARTGTSEFTVLLPHTEQTGAAIKAERLRRMIEATKFPLLTAQNAPLTVSIGISEYPNLSQDAESLVRTADQALAQVKAAGNRVCLASFGESAQSP